MSRRPGRKRKQGVIRHPCGQINDYVGREVPQDVPMNKELTWRQGKNRGELYLVRPSANIIGELDLTERQRRAGEEFAALRHSCAMYAWGAPQFTPKAANLHTGKSHAPERDPEEIVELGERFHAKYLATIAWVRTHCPRGSLGVMVAVCLENEPPTERQLFILRDALGLLAGRWGL